MNDNNSLTQAQEYLRRVSASWFRGCFDFFCVGFMGTATAGLAAGVIYCGYEYNKSIDKLCEVTTELFIGQSISCSRSEMNFICDKANETLLYQNVLGEYCQRFNSLGTSLFVTGATLLLAVAVTAGYLFFLRSQYKQRLGTPLSGIDRERRIERFCNDSSEEGAEIVISSASSLNVVAQHLTAMIDRLRRPDVEVPLVAVRPV